jgi:hypothetical protein
VVWLVYLCGCGLFWAAADREHRQMLFVMAAGLVAMQIWKVVDLGAWQWLASAATWVAAAGAIARHGVTQSATVAGLLLLSAMCYALGRIGGVEFAPFVAPLWFADAFGVAALVVAGGPGIARLVRRLDLAGRSYDLGRDS